MQIRDEVDQSVSSYNMNLTMAFLNWPIKTYIWNSGDGVFTTRVSLRHTTMFTYSHATTSLGQSEHAYYLSLLFYNKWRWLVVDIYRAAKRRGKYLPWTTDTEVNNYFSMY